MIQVPVWDHKIKASVCKKHFPSPPTLYIYMYNNKKAKEQKKKVEV